MILATATNRETDFDLALHATSRPMYFIEIERRSRFAESGARHIQTIQVKGQLGAAIDLFRELAEGFQANVRTTSDGYSCVTATCNSCGQIRPLVEPCDCTRGGAGRS